MTLDHLFGQETVTSVVPEHSKASNLRIQWQREMDQMAVRRVAEELSLFGLSGQPIALGRVLACQLEILQEPASLLVSALESLRTSLLLALSAFQSLRSPPFPPRPALEARVLPSSLQSYQAPLLELA